MTFSIMKAYHMTDTWLVYT